MKTLRNFKVSGYIVAGQDRTPAAPNDRITLFLDRVYDPTFPVSIVGTIVGVTPVNFGDDTSYDIRYNEADLTGAASYLRVEDVVDYDIITEIDVLRSELSVVDSAVFPRSQRTRLSGGEGAILTLIRTDVTTDNDLFYITSLDSPGFDPLSISEISNSWVIQISAPATVAELVDVINNFEPSSGVRLTASTTTPALEVFEFAVDLGNSTPATRVGQVIRYTGSDPYKMFMLTNLNPIQVIELGA